MPRQCSSRDPDLVLAVRSRDNPADQSPVPGFRNNVANRPAGPVELDQEVEETIDDHFPKPGWFCELASGTVEVFRQEFCLSNHVWAADWAVTL